ncbi:MAG: winged helix-turn-helix domain-containing protein [Proteobacteria bacterium]|nr:winged helix-turn-helix domain-containing protein [Pseudomonadota bacterium]
MTSASATAYRFARFTLDLSRGCLRDGESELRLRRKSFELLCYFAANAGRLLSKDELMAAVWPGIFVSDDSLVQCVREIRRALADDNHEGLKTVPGRGYLFDMPVSVIESPSTPAAVGPPATFEPPGPAVQLDDATGNPRRDGLHALWDRFRVLSPRWRAVGAGLVIATGIALAWSLGDPSTSSPTPVTAVLQATASAPALSIVVLPFANLSGDPNQDYLTDGLVEDITADLSRMRGGFVVSHRAALTYKDKSVDAKAVGREFGVRYVVLGSLRRSGEDTHFNVQLVEAESAGVLWAEQRHHRSDGQPGTRNRDVGQIARRLEIEMVAAEAQRSLRERPENPSAADLAMRGRALMDKPLTRESNEVAGRLFDAALALDGSSAVALLGVATTQLNYVFNGWSAEGDSDARLSRAEEALSRAIAQAPGDAFAQWLRGRLLRARSQPEQAIAAFERAIELDPSHVNAHAELGRTKMDVGLAAETISHIEQAVRLNPRGQDLYFWYFCAGQAAVYVGDDEAAVRWLRKAIEANPGYENAVAWLAVAYVLLGRGDEAQQVFAEFRRAHPDVTISGWDNAYPRRNPVVVAQRERIFEGLRRLGVPE